jgi:putative colanic acid biosynthesis UDP-glucose lipid carrier transferase
VQVVQRLVTLRDKLSGPDEGVESTDHVTNGITGSALTSSLATCTHIDGPAAYPAKLNENRNRPAEDISIAPVFRLAFTVGVGLCDAAAVIVAAMLIFPGAAMPGSVLTGIIVTLVGGHACGLYTTDSVAHAYRSARSTLALAAIFVPGAVAAVWIAYGAGVAGDVAVGLGCAMAVMLAARAGVASLMAGLGNRIAERVLIVGACDAVHQVVGPANGLRERAHVVGQIAIGDGSPAVPLIGRICGGSEPNVPVSFPTRGIDRVIVLRAGLDDSQLAAIGRHLEAISLPVHVLMDLPGGPGVPGALDNTGWVLRDRPISHSSMIAKRFLDLTVSGMALLFLAPLLLTVGALVRLDSPGPALFRQSRLGRDNQPFTVLKFRTMRVDAHASDGSVQATRGDPRVTRVGAFLRKTSIDELPQLLNVLNGSMSLVGPRPHPTELNKKFMLLIDSYSARHRIAPGITGWAQVNGFRGETRTIEQMQRRVELDLEYIRDRSVAFDLWILIRTVVSVFAHRNAAY